MMTDAEIIKALPEILYAGNGCKKCKHRNMSGDERCGVKGCYIARQALDLINRQKAEIERLKAKKELYLDRWQESLDFAKREMTVAIREFAERLKDKGCNLEETGGFLLDADDIDNLVKEMTEDGNE